MITQADLGLPLAAFVQARTKHRHAAIAEPPPRWHSSRVFFRSGISPHCAEMTGNPSSVHLLQLNGNWAPAHGPMRTNHQEARLELGGNAPFIVFDMQTLMRPWQEP
jgi:hypothetical protein